VTFRFRSFYLEIRGLYIKKVIIFFFIFVPIFAQLFAQEYVSEHSNIIFDFHSLFHIHIETEADYSSVNPLPSNFENVRFFSHPPGNNIVSDNLQNRQNASLQENDLLVFIGSLVSFSGLVVANRTMNSQEREIFNNTWEHQRNEERIRRRIFSRFNQ